MVMRENASTSAFWSAGDSEAQLGPTAMAVMAGRSKAFSMAGFSFS